MGAEPIDLVFRINLLLPMMTEEGISILTKGIDLIIDANVKALQS